MAGPKARRVSTTASPGAAPYVATDVTLERERQVLELRRAGYTLDVIAKTVTPPFADKSGASVALKRALARVAAPEAALLREIEGLRLERLMLALDSKIRAGDVKAIIAAERVSRSIRRLWGLDHADGLAERQLDLAQDVAARLIPGLQVLLEDLGVARDDRARAAVARYVQGLRLVELPPGSRDDDIVDADLADLVDPPAPAPRSRARNVNPAAKKAPVKRPTRKATATRLDQETKP
jgi:hypothetical protein